MQWTDDAIILTVRKHGENSAIVMLMSKEHGLYGGLVRGISSPKSRAVYQPGNRIAASWKARLSEHLGSLTGELIHSPSSLLLTDHQRLAALSSICTILATSLPEREKEDVLFSSLETFIALLISYKPWIGDYIRLEMTLLASLGFGLDLSECAATGVNDALIYVSPKTGKAVCASAGEPYKDKLLPLPLFLKDHYEAEDIDEIRQGMQLTGYFLEKWTFIPRNRKLPTARHRLQELLST